MSLPATFWSKTATTDCIIWTGAVNNKGYACFAIGGLSQLAHRLAWEDAHGPIADDMTVDHTCRVRNCVNVDHLELVSLAENIRRRFRVNGGLNIGGECVNEHPIASADDLYVNPKGRRECRECRRASAARAKERQTAA